MQQQRVRDRDEGRLPIVPRQQPAAPEVAAASARRTVRLPIKLGWASSASGSKDGGFDSRWSLGPSGERHDAGHRPVEDGGVGGRIDDALIVRGVNIYPSAIENVIREFPEVAEFAADVHRKGVMDDLQLRLEVTQGDGQAVARAVEQAIRDRLGLRVEITVVSHEALPRFELKAKRFCDHRVKEGP